MHLHSLRIKNFKIFEDTTFYFDENINILTGINNSGKTTVLEAIILWKMCFERLYPIIQAAANEQGKTEIAVHPRSMNVIRSTHWADLLSIGLSTSIFLEATLKNKDQEMSIAFSSKLLDSSTFIFSVEEFSRRDFMLFFANNDKAINLTYASPISNIPMSEEFVSYLKTRTQIEMGQSAMVFRNRLYNLYTDKRVRVWNDFLTDLSYILNNKTTDIHIKILGNPNQNLEVTVSLESPIKGRFTDIALMGSGTLQIMEILLSTYEEQHEINLILLDEPDSHIHRDIQKRLLSFLSQSSKNNQIFLTTHNESLIRSTRPQYLFHLEGAKRSVYKPIISEQIVGIERGLQPSYQIKILQSLGSETSLDILNALEADALIFVEGKDDALYIQKMLNNRYNNANFSKIMYWAFEGIDNLFAEIKYYKRIFETFKNEKTLWEKSILVFDKDYFTYEQREKLMSEIKNSLNIACYIWNCYTIESTILTDISQFSVLLGLFSEKYLAQKLDNKLLSQVIDKEIKLLSNELQNTLKEFEDKGALGNLILSKRNAIQGDKAARKDDRGGFVSDVFKGADSSFAPNFRNEILAELETNYLAPYVNKKQVDTLIKRIYKSMGIDLEEEISLYFPKMLDYAVHPRPWFSEWDKIVKLVEEKQVIN